MLLTMKKGILLSFAALLLIGVIVYGMWYINKRGEWANNSKDSFIPYNSALVVSFNPGMKLSSGIQKAFAADVQEFRSGFVCLAADTLMKINRINESARVLAVRLEGKSNPVFLWVMDNQDLLSRGDVADFFKSTFQEAQEKTRRYDNYKIYQLRKGEEAIYFAVEEGMILVSDSELYIEDALKQFEQESEGQEVKTEYRDVHKYFSTTAGVNVFLNNECFSGLLPLYIQKERLFEKLDISRCFKWGALDGEFKENGIIFNGFMHYGGGDASYMKTLQNQRPGESDIEGIIPSNPESFWILNLSDLKAYLAALENYRYDAGLIERIRKRKQEYVKALGKEAETELKALLQGEFALVNMKFNEASGENEGAVIACLKSGGLCKAWIEKVIQTNARYTGVHPERYYKTYQVDKEKSFSYYQFPVEDAPAVWWGYLFGGIKSRYVWIEDNYLLMASSEKVVTDFLKSYVHQHFVKEADWFKSTKKQLPAKSNLAYFANVRHRLPYYKYVVQKDLKEYMSSHEDRLGAFSTLALQWSNEGGMLYSTLFLNTEQVETDELPHMLWQTKLEAPMTLKPVIVKNHITGERELLVQDEQHTIYLINGAGRVLWKYKAEGKINSEVYQVDVFKNGKLQYLFSTSSAMYLLDRNGNPVQNFPVKFRAESKNGITVFDYDKNWNYRIFVPCIDRQVYLYDIKGELVKGWDSARADKEIVTPVMHYRVGNKDYIVYADLYRLYILDRKGKERVRVSTVFELDENTTLYLSRRQGKACLAFADCNGKVNLVDFEGRHSAITCDGMNKGAQLNVEDLDNDGVDEYIFTRGSEVVIYGQKGEKKYETALEASLLGYPYVYRFSGKDSRIGLLDKNQKKIFLLIPGKGISKGFPINGDSPFSVMLSNSGDFYLFAGTDEGSLIKYRVQL